MEHIVVSGSNFYILPCAGNQIELPLLHALPISTTFLLPTCFFWPLFMGFCSCAGLFFLVLLLSRAADCFSWFSKWLLACAFLDLASLWDAGELWIVLFQLIPDSLPGSGLALGNWKSGVRICTFYQWSFESALSTRTSANASLHSVTAVRFCSPR